MSEVKRAYDLLRGYIQREWDRISQVEWQDAARELEDSRTNAIPAAQSLPSGLPTSSAKVTAETPDPSDQACKILGVERNAAFSEIRTAYDQLNDRSEAQHFQPGSADALIAEKLRKRVQWAYQILAAQADDTSRRFGSLEIE